MNSSVEAIVPTRDFVVCNVDVCADVEGSEDDEWREMPERRV